MADSILGTALEEGFCLCVLQLVVLGDYQVLVTHIEDSRVGAIPEILFLLVKRVLDPCELLSEWLNYVNEVAAAIEGEVGI